MFLLRTVQSQHKIQKIVLPQGESIIGNFLTENLKLCLHPNKVIIRKYHQGIDFLGYVVLPHHKVLRTKTKRRITKKILKKKDELKNGLIEKKDFEQSLRSYLGALKHCEGHRIHQEWHTNM